MARAIRLVLVCALIAWAGAAYAQQDWKGPAKMSGKVMDEGGKALEGASVKLLLQTVNAGTDLVTDKKGEWKVEGIANGMWVVTLEKEGFDPKRFGVDVGGQAGKEPKAQVKLTKLGTDPQSALQMADEKAKVLADQKKYVEAAAVWEGTAANYPTIMQIHPQIARYYDMAGDFSKASDALKKFSDVNPTNIQLRLFLGNELIKAKRTEEAWKVFSAIDPAQVTDPGFFQDAGYDLLRQKQPLEAWKYFDILVNKFPTVTNAIYYRGFSSWMAAADIKPPESPEVKVKLDMAKEDLNKFLSSNPSGPEVDRAKEILKQIK